jgi:parallel beta-helix repeat protein
MRTALIAGAAATTFAGIPLASSATAVDCSAGGKLQTAINSAVAGDVIVVQGVCVESITVPDEAVRITIDGQGSGTVRSPSAGAATIAVLGRNITIKRLIITGGRSGIQVLRGGSALIDGNTIQQAAGSGILILQDGHARIVNNIIQSNTLYGIGVQESSIVRVGFLDNAGPVLGNHIQNNGAGGVAVIRGSSATLLGNFISENSGPGVLVSGTSYGLLAGNQIDANLGDGVAVSQNSAVQFGDETGIFDPPNKTVVPNGGAGVRCTINSSVNGILGTLTGTDGERRFDSGCANGPKIR